MSPANEMKLICSLHDLRLVVTCRCKHSRTRFLMCSSGLVPGNRHDDLTQRSGSSTSLDDSAAGG